MEEWMNNQNGGKLKRQKKDVEKFEGNNAIFTVFKWANLRRNKSFYSKILKNFRIEMAKIFPLFATIFVLANAKPLERKLTEQNSFSEEEKDNARKMFNFGDQNGDGQLSFEEFVVLTANFAGYSERQIEKMLWMPEMRREIFEEFDTNEDAKLSFEEFEMAYELRDNEIKRKMEIVEFKLMDSNGDGLVDFDEFVDFYAEGMDKEERDRLAQSESLHSAFERADRNEDGKIEMNELVENNEFETTTQNSTTPSTSSASPMIGSAGQLFDQIDANGDGILMYKECLDFVENGMSFSENQIARMKESSIPVEIFEVFDGNKDGEISMEEFKDNYLEIMGKKFAKRVFSMLFNMADENENGLVDYEEYVDWLAERENLNYQERNKLAKDQKMRREFDKIDTDGDGQISLAELLAAFYQGIGTTGDEGTTTMPSAQSTQESAIPPVEEETTSTMSTTPEQSTQEESSTIPSRGISTQLFEHFDENNDGQWELDEALDYYGNMAKMGEEEKERVGQSKSFKKLFDLIDVNLDGKLSLLEFMKMMELDAEEKLEIIFKGVDENEDGFVEFDELIAFIGDMRGLNVEEREELNKNGQIRIWFEEVDKNGNGKLELEECKEKMLEMEATKKMIENEMEMVMII